MATPTSPKLKRQTAFKVAAVYVSAWGLLRVAMAIHDHGLMFSSDLGTGLAFAVIGIGQLIWGGRRFPASGQSK